MMDKFDELIQDVINTAVYSCEGDNTCSQWEFEVDIARSTLRDAIVALEAERDALKEAQRWIPVEERLPEEQVDVIGQYSYDGENEKFVGGCDLFCDKWFDGTGTPIIVFFWMPLPKPPAVQP